jgi:amidase
VRDLHHEWISFASPVHPFAPLTIETTRTLGRAARADLQAAALHRAFRQTGDSTITLPGGFSRGGLPIGFQLAAGQLGETKLVRAARAFQRLTAWHRRHPLN